MAYWNFQGLEVALIIVICVIGFALIACTTAAIWFTVAQRNKKARIPRRHLSSSDRPYIGRPVEPMVMEEGHLVKDKSKQDRAYRELTKPDGLVITSV